MASANRLKKWRENKTEHSLDNDKRGQQEEIIVLSNKRFVVFKDDEKPARKARSRQKALQKAIDDDIKESKMRGERNPQLVVLKDYYHYGVITKQEYADFRAILLDENVSQTKKDAVMRHIRALL